jgi:hypothetical protein
MRCTLKKRLAICFAIGIFIISPMVIYGCAGGYVHGQWGNNTKKETEPDQHQATYEYKSISTNIKKMALHHMHRPMDIEQSTSTGIILLGMCIMILRGDFIST